MNIGQVDTGNLSLGVKAWTGSTDRPMRLEEVQSFQEEAGGFCGLVGRVVSGSLSWENIRFKPRPESGFSFQQVRWSSDRVQVGGQ